MVLFTLACWLFMRSGYGVVLSKLTDAYAVEEQGWGDWQAPWTGSISKAKAKLAAAATGAQLCWRMSASFRLPVLQVLPDGTYVCELRPPRKKDGPPIRVRVIEYSVVTVDEDGEEHSELFALATTLLDVEAYSAIGLAQLYHLRWQAETGIGDLKTTVRGGPEVVLRSRTPAMVEQEFWAFLCVYQAIRHLISYAAPAGLDPGRISFTRALEAARDSVPRAALSPLPH